MLSVNNVVKKGGLAMDQAHLVEILLVGFLQIASAVLPVFIAWWLSKHSNDEDNNGAS